MANQKWSEVFTANPSTKIQSTDVINLSRSGSPTAGQWGVLSKYQNVIYIANNGDDTHGNGSLLCPYATGPAVETFISSASPSATNKFLIIDQRTGVINENVKFIPFVYRMGNGLAELNGNWTMSTLFSSIVTETFSGISNYKSLGVTTPGTVVFDFSSYSLSNAIYIYLENFEKAIFTGTYKGNDSANFNADTFRVNEYAFNTGGFNPDRSPWQADCSLSSGITRRIRFCEGWQQSSITKSLGSAVCVTFLDVAFCGTPFYDPSSATLQIISTGGATNQPIIQVSALNCLSGFSSLFLDITNDGASYATFTTDITTGYYINSANSLTNFMFNSNSVIDYQTSYFTPINYTPTAYTNDGFDVTTQLLGAQLQGIDNKLGTISSSSFDAGFMYGFQLKWNAVGPPVTVTVGTGSCVDSTNAFNMNLANPVTLDTTSASIDNGASWTTNRWYAIWLYENSTTLATTVKFSLSFSSPATISGYDKIRLIGSVRGSSLGTDILSFVQTGLSNDRTYTWINGDTALGLLSNGNAVSGAPGTFSCTGGMSPLASEINIQMRFTAGLARGGDTANISDADFNVLPMVYISGQVASILSAAPSGYLPVNSSQQLSYFVDNSLDRLDLIATGYKESL